MAVRTITFVSTALFVGIAAFVLHLLALCSPHWKIIRRDALPIMTPVSYGIWERCEYANITVIKQGVALGTRVNVQYCFPNRYMRYTPESFTICNARRRDCAVPNKENVPDACQCRYLPSAKALQWLTVLAAICLLLGLILLYLRSISAPKNNSAAFVLGFGPFICFFLTLLLVVTGLIIFCAYLRRDTYEDNSFPVAKITNRPAYEAYNLHGLRNYAKSDAIGNFSREDYLAAENELRTHVDSHYHTVIDRAMIYEIIAAVLIFFGTALTFILGILTGSEGKI